MLEWLVRRGGLVSQQKTKGMKCVGATFLQEKFSLEIRFWEIQYMWHSGLKIYTVSGPQNTIRSIIQNYHTTPVTFSFLSNFVLTWHASFDPLSIRFLPNNFLDGAKMRVS